MGIEYLYFAEDGMCDDYISSCFANEPIAGYDIDGCTIKRVRVYTCGDNGKSGKYDEA